MCNSCKIVASNWEDVQSSTKTTHFLTSGSQYGCSKYKVCYRLLLVPSASLFCFFVQTCCRSVLHLYVQSLNRKSFECEWWNTSHGVVHLGDNYHFPCWLFSLPLQPVALIVMCVNSECLTHFKIMSVMQPSPGSSGTSQS